jgi:hypothetical protein
MAWNDATHTLASQPFYLQDDTDWMSQPQVQIHTPLGMAGSILHWTGSPSPTRTVVGYVISQNAYDALLAAAQAGTATTWGSEDVVITALQGKLQDVVNLAYCNLVTVQLIKDETPA